MMRCLGHALRTQPFAARLVWVLFAVAFYMSGEAFTVWLLEPERMTGAAQWFWATLFPVLLPAFFIINRYLGCATGACAQGQCDIGTDHPPGH